MKKAYYRLLNTLEIDRYKEAYITIFLLIFVGVGGFFLGRMSVDSGHLSHVQIHVEESAGEVVASQNGTKYHYPWCAGARRIASKNLITFASIEEARVAGFLPATNCKGLQ